MFPSSHRLQRESFFSEWKCPRGLLTWLWSDWIGYVVVQHFSRSVTISILCFTTYSVLVLFLVLCEVSVHVYDYMYTFVYKLKVVMGLQWEHFQILIFCVVVARSFPSFCSYIIMRSWCELVDMRWYCSGVPPCGCGAECSLVNVWWGVVSNGHNQPNGGEWYALAALLLWGQQALSTGLWLVSSKYCACCRHWVGPCGGWPISSCGAACIGDSPEQHAMETNLSSL